MESYYNELDLLQVIKVAFVWLLCWHANIEHDNFCMLKY